MKKLHQAVVFSFSLVLASQIAKAVPCNQNVLFPPPPDFRLGTLTLHKVTPQATCIYSIKNNSCGASSDGTCTLVLTKSALNCVAMISGVWDNSLSSWQFKLDNDVRLAEWNNKDRPDLSLVTQIPPMASTYSSYLLINPSPSDPKVSFSMPAGGSSCDLAPSHCCSTGVCHAGKIGENTQLMVVEDPTSANSKKCKGSFNLATNPVSLKCTSQGKKSSVTLQGIQGTGFWSNYTEFSYPPSPRAYSAIIQLEINGVTYSADSTQVKIYLGADGSIYFYPGSQYVPGSFCSSSH